MIVCLSGSTKFKEQFEDVNYEECLKGNVVLAPGVFSHYDRFSLSDSQLQILKELHFKKIDMCDEMIVLNINGYIGDGLRSEIEYAYKQNKKVTFLEPVIDPETKS